MIIVLSVFNGGQTHSVGCPHIGFEAVKEIRVLFCTTAIFEVVVCESVNECPPDGSIIGAGVVADVSLLLDAAQQPYRAAGVQGLVEAADPEDGIEYRQPCALAEESFCSSSALSIFPNSRGRRVLRSITQ